jgi:hypothetical protein
MKSRSSSSGAKMAFHDNVSKTSSFLGLLLDPQTNQHRSKLSIPEHQSATFEHCFCCV